MSHEETSDLPHSWRSPEQDFSRVVCAWMGTTPEGSVQTRNGSVPAPAPLSPPRDRAGPSGHSWMSTCTSPPSHRLPTPAHPRHLCHLTERSKPDANTLEVNLTLVTCWSNGKSCLTHSAALTCHLTTLAATVCGGVWSRKPICLQVWLSASHSIKRSQLRPVPSASVYPHSLICYHHPSLHTQPVLCPPAGPQTCHTLS